MNDLHTHRDAHEHTHGDHGPHSRYCEAPEDNGEHGWLDLFQDEAGGDRNVQRLASIFKVLGDPTRLRILRVLLQGERCVCDLAGDIGMEQSAVSHQLRVLRQAHVVDFRKEGKVAWYFLDDDHVVNLMEQGMAHVAHQY